MAQIVAEKTSVDHTMVQFLEGAARRCGDRTALLFKPGFRYQRWSYSDLWEEAGRVASLLQQRGLTKGDRALLWGPNCPQWVLAFFGCLRAGVIAVPLDLRSPLDLVERVAAKTSPKIAFVSRVTPDSHEQMDLPKVYFEQMEELCEGLSPPEPVELAPEDLVEIMFTSGTTGDPKGVMLTHRNLTSNVAAIREFVPGKLSDRLLSILPLSHMIEQAAGLLVMLAAGASITYPASRQPTVLFRTMKERRVTMLFLVPQALDLFMKGIEREVKRQGKERVWNLSLKAARYLPFRLRRVLFRRVHQKFGGSLSLIFAGGAALDPELGAKWELLGLHVMQGYGTTEASPVITLHPVERPRYDSPGRALPGVEVKISDEGEVLVRGANVTPGYWEAPEQTEASFEDGWYRTGDQGSLSEDGFLHLHGRKKDMIVLPSGQNVYPEDIEAVLNKHPGLKDAAVVGLPKGSDVEVHAVFLMDDPAGADEVVSWANSQLGEQQRVRGFTVWHEEDLPRTHTLKVKKGVLLDYLQGTEAATPAVSKPSEKPQQSGIAGLQRLIAEIGRVDQDEVRPERSLGEDLGLDSLGRVELLSAIEGELGVYLDESQVGPDTTVQELSTLVERGSSEAADVRFPRWGMSPWCRPLRGSIQRGLMFPMLRAFYRLRVSGKENLHGVQGPVLFAANHNLGLDNGLIIKAIPSQWRKRLAIAAAAKLWRSPIAAVFNPLLGNGFPFSQEGAVRASLENLGSILDDGWSVLIYPEGKLTIGGPIQPFMSGTGLVAVGGGVPVVPLKLHIHSMGSYPRLPLLPRGDMEVRFGKPLEFSRRTSYADATSAIEQAVRAL